ncbi:MAG: hypothetical protein HY049_08395 [Acidobacteria bacterium]|nr:hypothetical protein [Acidobacteriota bacterium]
MAFLDSFLAGYDYDSARAIALRDLTTRKHIDVPEIYDARDTFRKHHIKLPAEERVGIPQGAALSCILANAVLASADESTRTRLNSHRQSFYARYCDDILIVSTNRRACASALAAYCRTLTRLGLPFHPLLDIDSYRGRDVDRFWGAKSKRPYSWGRPARKEGVPWVGFVGYQLKRDGTLRIRRSSVDKELRKIRKVVDDVLGQIDVLSAHANANGHKHRMPSLRSLRERLLRHLVSIGVGHPQHFRIWPTDKALCWCRGFQLLNAGPVNTEILRNLDEARSHAVTVLVARVLSLSRVRPVEMSPKSHRQSRSRFVLGFTGRPLAYFSQFPRRPSTGHAP